MTQRGFDDGMNDGMHVIAFCIWRRVSFWLLDSCAWRVLFLLNTSTSMECPCLLQLLFRRNVQDLGGVCFAGEVAFHFGSDSG